MWAGVFISAVSHVVLVALALLGTPKLFDSPQLAAIEVDLVRPEEVEPPKEKPPEQKPAFLNPLPESSAPQPEAAAPKAEPKPPAAANQQALGPPVPSPPATPQPSATPSIFDPANIPALLNLPNAPEHGFDTEATITANLSDGEKAAFKAHLRKCWTLPDGMSPAQTTRVVLRIYLKRDGGLSAEPLLIEGPASRDGPALLKAAIRTLKDCQPFAFLPADKYREWRMLDVGFSPREMSGG